MRDAGQSHQAANATWHNSSNVSLAIEDCMRTLDDMEVVKGSQIDS